MANSTVEKPSNSRKSDRDVEIVPSGASAKPLNAQLRDALFSDDVPNKENA